MCTYLDEVADPQAMPEGSVKDLVQAFLALEPYLRWYVRNGNTTNAAWFDSHASTGNPALSG